MNISRTLTIWISVSIVLIFFCPVAFGQKMDILENLRKYDQIYSSGITLNGTRIWKDLNEINMEDEWVITRENQKVAFSFTTTNINEIELEELDKSPTSIHASMVGYWGADLSGILYKNQLLRLNSDNKVELGNITHNKTLYLPDAVGPNVQRRTLLWSAGRSFSEFITKIESVTTQDDGKLLVSAIGSKSDYQHGRWDLIIDPGAAWMVREARFYYESGNQRIALEMKNTGTQWFGEYCIPASATLNYTNAIDGEGSNKKFLNTLTFTSLEKTFNENLYSDSFRSMTVHDQKMLSIDDNRTVSEQDYPLGSKLETVRTENWSLSN